MMSEQRNLRHF